MMTNKKRRGLLSSGLILGAIIGAVAAFFLAPEKGSDTKKRLARGINNVTQKSISKAQDALIDLEVTLEAQENDGYTNL